MEFEQFLPELDALQRGADGTEGADGPGVHAQFVLKLTGRPARVTHVGAQGEASLGGEPHGLFLVGYLDGTPVATGGWRRHGEHDAEIKRMYVNAAARGRGLARAVLAELEETARAAGLHRLVLETGDEQPEAIALYRSSGYTPVTPFGYYADAPESVHLGKILVHPHQDTRRSADRAGTPE